MDNFSEVPDKLKNSSKLSLINNKKPGFSTPEYSTNCIELNAALILIGEGTQFIPDILNL